MFPSKAPKTVDSIMSAFNNTVSQLEAVEQSRHVAADQKRKEAEALLAEAEQDAREADRANSVAAKLRSITSN